jgi:outer membrane protein OmpA-like peptidoglycan-associated protein/Tol biopolymer transport system component
MKSIIQVLFTAIFIVICTISSQAQTISSDLKTANQLYERYAYTPAIEYYKKVIARGDNWEAKSKLADCYRKINDPLNAEYYYGQVVLNPQATPEQKLYYAQMLQQNGKYPEAKQWYAEFSRTQPNDKRGANGIAACDQIVGYYKDSSLIRVTYMPFNSENSDITPSYFQDGIVFASDRKVLQRGTYEWTGAPFLSFYYVKKIGNEYSAPSIWYGKANTKYHEAGATFTKGFDEQYFTRVNINNGKTQHSSDKTIKLKIYRKTAQGTNWSEANEFPYNSNEYSTGHPTLSLDGQSLYFASDRPGGYGQVDIYVCKREGDSWSLPQNLGSTINTEGNEMFPFISKDNKLYFASNGLSGMGGLDIFVSTYQNGAWSTPKNLGAPINGSRDDFALTTETGGEGYFCSNRKGSDDIYSYKKTCLQLNGLVYDEKTGDPLEMANVKVIDLGTQKEVKITDDKGKFNLCLSEEHEYEFIANKDGYLENKVRLSTVNFTGDQAEVKIPLGKEAIFDLKGKVYNESTKLPMAGIKVTLLNLCDNKTQETITGEDGKYSFKLQAECKYKVTAVKENCASNTQEKSTIGLKTSQTLYLDFGMLCVGDIVKIDNIYYDLDKSAIRPDAAKELDKTIVVLAQYPTMHIELRSHTDCRAPDDYNMSLSQRRAQSAVNYLISKGVAKERMKATGYGETLPVNRCVDGVQCTDAEHQANRRTEFKILSF